MFNYIEIQNVKRLRFVQLDKNDLDSPVVVLEGKNAQGKTSIIDALAMAVCGQGAMPDNPIREGEETASVVLKTTDDYKIERRISKVKTGKNKGALKTELRVWDKSGNIVAQPQTFLNGLLGKSIMRPLEIVHESPKERAQKVKEALSIDFSNEDAEKLRVEQERTELGRKAKLTEGNLQAYTHLPEHPQQLRSSEEVLRDISVIDKMLDDERNAEEKGRGKEEEINKMRGELSWKKRDIINDIDEMKKLDNEKKRLLERIQEIDQMIVNLKRNIITNEGKVKKLDDEIDLIERELGKGYFVPEEELEKRDRLKDELAKVHNNLKMSEEIRMRGLLKRRLKDEKSSYNRCTERINEIIERKRAILRNTVFPVHGMGFGSEDVTFNGIDFSQCSMSEKIKISIAINALINPAMRIMVLEDGSSLDDKSMREIQTIAKKSNYQIFVEKVRQTKFPHCLVIEEGTIK